MMMMMSKMLKITTCLAAIYLYFKRSKCVHASWIIYGQWNFALRKILKFLSQSIDILKLNKNQLDAHLF
jgi:hypothetical protein